MKKLALNIALLLFFSSSAFAQSMEAGKIMQKLKEQILAPIAFVCVEMKIFNAENNLKRTFVFKRGYLYDGEKEKILISFIFPPDIERTKYLLVEDINNIRKEEAMWLPSFGRERPIANATEGSLQGSHYFFYDLLEHIDEFNYSLISQQGKIFTISAEPKAKPRVYGRLIIKAEEIVPGVFVYRETVFFDKNGKEWKKETYEDFFPVWGKYYRPKEMKMEDLKTRKKTTLSFTKWEVRPLTESDIPTFQRSFLIKDQAIPPERCK